MFWCEKLSQFEVEYEKNFSLLENADDNILLSVYDVKSQIKTGREGCIV